MSAGVNVVSSSAIEPASVRVSVGLRVKMFFWVSRMSMAMIGCRGAVIGAEWLMASSVPGILSRRLTHWVVCRVVSQRIWPVAVRE